MVAQRQPERSTSKDSSLILRQSVRRVRVDVVVTNAQGHLVTGLQASDFRVAEDGRPQSIRQFEYHSDDKSEAALPKRPPLPPHTFMNLPESPEHGPLTVLLYDMLNTPLEEQLYAREALVHFLKKSSGRRIAIFVLGDRLRLLQGFTSDVDLIERALKDPSTKPQRSNISYSASAGAEDMARLKDGTGADKTVNEMIAARKQLQDAEASARMDLRVDMTTDALKQIGRFLAGTSGRKNLIWYSGSFPAQILLAPPNPLLQGDRRVFFREDRKTRDYSDRIKAATNLLNSAEVAVYPIDAQGLQTLSLRENPQMTGRIATMDMIGEQTGGRAFYNTNGLEESLEKASEEGASYYSMVYAPTNSKYDGSVRRISVHLGQGNYHLAYRRSYIADDVASIARDQSSPGQIAASPDGEPAKVDLMAPASQFGAPPSRQLIFTAFVDAIGAPAPATAEQMAALVPYLERAAKNARRKFTQPQTPVPMQQYAIAYAVLGSQLDLPKSTSGVYHSDLSMAALAFNEDGETLWGTKTELKDEIPASKIESLRKDGFQAMQTLFVPVDTAVIRLVVRDEHSERVGSMEVRLPLPSDQQQSAVAR
jgi:VWFA-related protein